MENMGQHTIILTQKTERPHTSVFAHRRGKLILPLLIGSAIGTVILSSFALSGAVRKIIFRNMQDAAYAQNVTDMQQSENAGLPAPVNSRQESRFTVYLQSFLQTLPMMGSDLI